MRIVLKHNLADHARIRNGACFGILQVSATQCFEKAAVNIDPEIALKVIMCLSHVKHAGQHQALHQFHQAPVSTGSSDG